MFYFYHLKTLEYHRVFKSFQSPKNETLADNGLRLLCLYKYKPLVLRIKWNDSIGKPRCCKWMLWISGMLLKASWRSLTLPIWNVIIRRWTHLNGKVIGFSWNAWKYTFDRRYICFFLSLKYSLLFCFYYSN